MRLLLCLGLIWMTLAGCSPGFDAVDQTAIEVRDPTAFNALEVAQSILEKHGFAPSHAYLSDSANNDGLRFYAKPGAYASLEQVTPRCFTLVSYVRAGSAELSPAQELLLSVRGQAHTSASYKIPDGETCGAP
jgi:hypothetical protein